MDAEITGEKKTITILVSGSGMEHKELLSMARSLATEDRRVIVKDPKFLLVDEVDLIGMDNQLLFSSNHSKRDVIEFFNDMESYSHLDAELAFTKSEDFPIEDPSKMLSVDEPTKPFKNTSVPIKGNRKFKV